MKYTFPFKDMVFNFGQTSAHKDGYFEYIDKLNPIGVMRINFVIEQKGNEVNVKTFHPKSEAEAKLAITKEAIELLNTFVETGILSDAVVTGFRIHFNYEKKQPAARLAVYTFPNGDKQYMYASEPMTYFLNDNANKPTHKQDKKPKHHHKHHTTVSNDAVAVQPIVEPDKDPEPATPAMLQELSNHYNSDSK